VKSIQGLRRVPELKGPKFVTEGVSDRECSHARWSDLDSCAGDDLTTANFHAKWRRMAFVNTNTKLMILRRHIDKTEKF